jgi:hypothetical protein
MVNCTFDVFSCSEVTLNNGYGLSREEACAQDITHFMQLGGHRNGMASQCGTDQMEELAGLTVAHKCPDQCCNTPEECRALGNFNLQGGPVEWEGRLTLSGLQFFPQSDSDWEEWYSEMPLTFQADVAVCADEWTVREAQVRRRES